MDTFWKKIIIFSCKSIAFDIKHITVCAAQAYSIISKIRVIKRDIQTDGICDASYDIWKSLMISLIWAHQWIFHSSILLTGGLFILRTSV